MSAAADTTIRTDIQGGRLTVTLDRQAEGNTVTRAMLARLAEVLDEAAAAAELRVLVLTGAGEAGFSAGVDAEELAAQTGHAVAAHDFDRQWDAVSGRLAAFPALTLARIHGVCAGGGLSLALACDLRVASRDAQLAYAALAGRVLPTSVDVERLTALIGAARCKALLMTGTRLDGEQALGWGLVEAVAEPDGLDETVDTLCAAALAAEPHEVLAIKRLCGPRSDYAMVDLCYRAMYDADKAARRRLREG